MLSKYKSSNDDLKIYYIYYIMTSINKNIVFSGFTDKKLKEKLLNKGYNISNVTRENTQYVIVKDPYKSYPISSAKIKMALRLGIPIIPYDLFIKNI